MSKTSLPRKDHGDIVFIGCSNYFVPIHLQPVFVERFGYEPGTFPVCEAVAARTVALPFHHALTGDDVDRVCTEFHSLL